jgi:polyvinyl alcohol dehydrogenase (cytochrome)
MMNIRLAGLGAAILLSCISSAASGAQAAEDEALFQQFCAACHTDQPAATGSPNERAPTLRVLKTFTPEAVLNALTNGKMQPQGLALSEAQRRVVSEYASGQRLVAATPSGPAVVVNRCKANPPLPAASTTPSWNGYGNGATGARFQDATAAGFTAADLPRLKLKWAFGYANVSAARAQPSFAAGRLFVASENGEVQSLDPRTGCAYWTFKAQAGVRTSPVVGEYRKSGGGSGQAVFFGDGRANAYALDAHSGVQLWTRKVHSHASASITGGLNAANGRVFVPVQGLNEEGHGSRDNYPCCSFRGALVALDTADGHVLWTTYTIDEPKPRAKSAAGVQMMGPAGGAIWSQPTLDARRELVYVATGNAYADPPQKMTNAVIAIEQRTGKVAWYQQIIRADQWAMGCEAKNPNNPACPETLGPDYDFSASPALVRSGARDLLVLPQKSAIAYALDPDKKGELVWEQRFGKGSGLGGQWGGASDGELFFTGLADFLTNTPGGVHALRLTDGKPVWSAPPPQPLLCGEKRPGCSPGQGSAVTAIRGAVFSGSLDGGLRAYSSKDGKVIWTFDTNREFQTVNGVKANGASMDGPGVTVAGGMVFVNSGYGGLVGRPGNVLLAFGLE